MTERQKDLLKQAMPSSLKADILDREQDEQREQVVNDEIDSIWREQAPCESRMRMFLHLRDTLKAKLKQVQF